MYNILFRFEQKGLEPVTITSANVEDSLLEVALLNDINLHHNCGGVCACSTCHVYIQKGDELLQEISDKEEDFIDRAIRPRINSRLGCQCMLQPGGGSIELIVPDQSQFLGE